MKELEIKHFLDGLIYLDTINLEEKLKESPSVIMFADNLFFDLSKCRFAELGALAQLILTIESYMKSNHTIFIALPSVKPTTNQLKTQTNQESVEDSIEKQKAATNFIKKTGFVSVLQKISKEYKTEIYFTEELDYKKKGTKINIDWFTDTFTVIYDEIIINEANYKCLFPFKLIDTEKDNFLDTISEFEKTLEKVLENEERGIDNFDVKVIKNVIIPELIKNVKNHSSTRYAIFTVGLINTKSIFYIDNYDEYLLKAGAKRKINRIERLHIKNIKEFKIESQVEIYFGDCGRGIINDEYKSKVSTDFKRIITEPEELLKIAFDRWSTIQDNEPRRGTKGLYRLKRVVDKYKGIIHIKTSKSNGGFFNGQFECRELISSFKGTLINIRLNSQRENKSFKISNLRQTNTIPWVSEKIIINDKLKWKHIVKENILTGKNLLLITDISSINLSFQNKLFEDFLYEISFLSHPSAIVIYLINNEENIDSDTIETFVDSVKRRITEVNKDSLSPDSDEPEQEEIHDPVLVIANNNQTFWYGGSEKLIAILNESFLNLQENKSFKISELTSYEELDIGERQEIRNYLETDNNLVVLDNDEMIEFNFYGIEKHYENKIRNFIPRLNNKNICTSKLSIVKSWIDINELLQDDEFGFALCLYIKFHKYYDEIGNLNKNKTFVLIDSTIQLNLAKKFNELIGLKTKNIRNIEDEIDYSMPKRTKLFNEKSYVIFLTTIVSSSETIRRLVKYAKRDKAIPEVILCLMNSRTRKIDKLETWNETTDIISIYQKNKNESDDLEKNAEYFSNKIEELKNPDIIINPQYTVETEKEVQKNIFIEEQLLNYLKDNKFLHYNHFGHYNRRHFTFYLDKLRIMDSISSTGFMSDKLTNTIANWKVKNNIDKFTLYINKSLINHKSSFELFLKSISILNYKFINIEQNNIYDKNSIYFDFGILTGDSINNLINKVEEVDNLLICILFNQSVNTNADIYKKIDKLKFSRDKELIPDKRKVEIKEVKFQIEYLFNLPLSFFNSETCPICEHRRALDYYKLDNAYFEEFINDRSERLKQNSSDEINDLEYPVDFYFSDKENEKKQELSKVIIFQMYELKILLENASFLTKYRIELYHYIYSLYLNIENEIKNQESKVYSLIYYLSYEINWLQREPFVFRDFRILLSKIAYKVATIDINLLISHFIKKEINKIPYKNLTTRYKYSAVSVLRSTDKLLFCQSIYEIIKSSYVESICSNNLLQNTLYHTSSFFKNSYNKSEVYFFYISNNLEKILQELKITENQKNSIHYIINENKKSRLKTYTVKKEPKVFRLLKDEWMNIYYETPGHPITYEYFKDLNISKVKSLFDNEDYLIILNKTLEDNWNNLKMYLMNLFIEKFENNFDLLKSSSYFKQKFETTLESSFIWREKIERIDAIINQFLLDSKSYEKNEKEYNEILEKFREVFIQKKGLSDFADNSKLLYLLDDFPSNITEYVNNVFNEFPNKSFYYLKNIRSNEKLNINLNEEFYVYYPKSLILKYLELIKQNLLNRLNAGKIKEDVNLKFEINTSEKNYLNMTIKYDCTDENTGTIKNDGALNGWCKSLQEFGGSLEFNTPKGNCNDFIIKLKFLRYEF